MVETFTLPQAAAVAQGLVTYTLILTQNILTVRSVKVNGTPKTVVDAITYGGDLTLVWFYFPGGPYVNSPTAGGDVPVDDDVVDVDYLPYSTSSQGTTGNPLTPTPLGGTAPGSLNNCGSGKYEAVQFVQDLIQGDGLAAASSQLIAKFGSIPLVVEFDTYEAGIKPAQSISIDLPGMFVNTYTLIVVSVNGYCDKPDPASGKCFRWHVRCTDRFNSGNWEQWMEDFVKRSQSPLPALALDTYRWDMDVDVDELVVTDGQSYDINVVASVAPVDQDLVVSITRVSDSVEVASLILGATTNTGNVNYNIAGAGQFVFSGDQLHAAYSYNVSGGSPVAASGVTVTFRVKI